MLSTYTMLSTVDSTLCKMLSVIEDNVLYSAIQKIAHCANDVYRNNAFYNAFYSRQHIVQYAIYKRIITNCTMLKK